MDKFLENFEKGFWRNMRKFLKKFSWNFQENLKELKGIYRKYAVIIVENFVEVIWNFQCNSWNFWKKLWKNWKNCRITTKKFWNSFRVILRNQKKKIKWTKEFLVTVFRGLKNHRKLPILSTVLLRIYR